MKITMLGTGNAQVTECYNTCFVLEEEGRCLLVDGGGGNTLLRQLKRAGYDWMDMREIFVTHRHVDHLLGILWMMRMICQNMHRGLCQGEAWIYGHDEVIRILCDTAEKLLSKKDNAFIGDRLHMVTLHDGEVREVIGRKTVFFDIQSVKAKQYGFSMDIGNGRKLTCCGDEPYNDCEEIYARNSDWLLHEAFCLSGEADIFRPYEKRHSTAKDAAELAEKLGVKNLLLYHTEDKNILKRKELYTAEAEKYFHGNIFVPEDLETLEL